MNHKLISLRIILFLLFLYYLRHCAPKLYSYGLSRAVPAGNFKTLLVAIQSASFLVLAPRNMSSCHPPETSAGSPVVSGLPPYIPQRIMCRFTLCGCASLDPCLLHELEIKTSKDPILSLWLLRPVRSRQGWVCVAAR